MDNHHYPPSLDEKLKTHLEILQDVPERDEKRALRGRNQFLAEVNSLKQSVTPTGKRRHSIWMMIPQTILPFRKEGASMLTQVVSILVILATLLGGAGAGTVYASQDSMPNEVLYPIKLWSENARLSLNPSPEKDVALLIDFAERRVQEMLFLEKGGEIPPDAMMEQLHAHLELALQSCGETEDPVQTREQVRQQLMAQKMLLDNVPESALVLQTREMLQQKIHQIEQSQMIDPALQQDQLEQQDRDRLRTDQPVDAGNLESNGYQEEQTPGGSNPNPDASGQQNTEGSPQRTKTPMPNSSGQPQGPGGPETNKNSPNK